MEVLSRRQRIELTPWRDRRPNSRTCTGPLGLRRSRGPNRSQRLGEARHARKVSAAVRADQKAKRIKAAIERIIRTGC